MAVIEIQAATLPGFPYYFPYRTGVRTFNSVTAEGTKVYYGDTDVAITAEATVTSLRDALVDADLSLVNSTDQDSLRDALVDADQTALFAVALDFLRESSFGVAETITALRTVVASRGQQLEALVELTAWLDNLANINAVSGTIDPVIEVTIPAEIQLNAVGDTELALVSDTSAAQILDAVTSAELAISNDAPSDGDSYIGLQSDTIDVAATISADALRSVEMAGSVGITAQGAAEVSQNQPLSATVGITAVIAAKVTNGDVTLTLSALPEAEVVLTRYLDAELAATANILVDALDTRYGDTALTVAAEPTAEATLAAVTAADLEVATGFLSDSLRDALVDAAQSVLAAVLESVSQEQPFQASLELIAQLTGEPQADFVDEATLDITAAGTAEGLRITYAVTQTDVTADAALAALRMVYAETDLQADIVLTPFPFISLGTYADPIPYAVTAAPDGFMHGDYVGNSHLDLLGSSYPMPNAYFLVAAVLRAMVEPTSAGVMSMKINAHLDTTAVIDLLNIHRQVWAVAEEMQILASLEEYRMYFIWLVQAELAALADNPAAVLYRHSGGNPMWLMFFYGGEGRRTL